MVFIGHSLGGLVIKQVCAGHSYFEILSHGSNIWMQALAVS